MSKSYFVMLSFMFVGCGDSVTAPQAESLLRSAESLQHAFERAQGQFAVTGEERMWQRLGHHLEMATFDGSSRLTVQWDVGARQYSAAVVERLVMPEHDSSRDECIGPRWTLMLWTSGARPSGMVLRGGTFDEPLSEPLSCRVVNFDRPEPVLLAYPSEDDPNQYAWRATSGRGYISPGRPIGACTFLAPEATASLLRDYAVTCSRTEHTVEFDAELRRLAPKPTGARDGVEPTGLQRRVRLPATAIQGVRYTIDCSRIVRIDLCGRFR